MARASRLVALSGALSCCAWPLGAAAQPLLGSFLPPKDGIYAANSDLVPAHPVASADECASACLGFSSCISFNLCTNANGTLECGVSAINAAYEPVNATTCQWYRRIIERDDRPVVQAVPWRLQVPATGVHLTGGPLAQGFLGNMNNYLKVRDPLDMLFFFAQRAGVENPPGKCFGWDAWIKGSATGNYLMGAGSTLRWLNDSELRANVETVVAGIRKYQAADGWLYAFSEDDMVWRADNLPDYCASWVIRGLLDAHSAGVPDALAQAREQISIFNNHTALPWILPQNGGPNPVTPYPSGFNNETNGGYGQPYGHMIYIEYQGMVKHTLMALSEVGTQADVDIIEDLYQEDWWLQALLNRDPYHAIWHRQFFSHNYEVTAYEAFLDMYVMTGNMTYLTAMFNAWSMLRESWILPGGSFALNEGRYYPPGSYYIGFTGQNPSAAHQQVHPHAHAGHSHDAAHAHAATAPPASGDPYYHAPCMPRPGEQPEQPHLSPLVALKQAAMARDPEAGARGSPNADDPPTGELCGSVFWTKFNQRFHRLFPDNETFVLEMERSILNVGLAALGWPGSGGQGPNGTGIRYFANQHKRKQNPSMHASCCEGQGTRLFGSLPEYVYTLAAPMGPGGGLGGPATGVSVDMFGASNISFPTQYGTATLVQDTAWPYGEAVALTLTMPGAGGALDVGLRIPAWVTAPSVAVTVNGKPWPVQGVPGTFLHVAQTWPAGPSTLSFALPMALSTWNYTGASQLPPYSRWAYLYGPVLLATEGPWNATLDALVMPPEAALDPSQPAAWMTPAGDGNSLHFNVTGAPGFSFKPYFEIQDGGELFSVYPCFPAA